MTTPLILISGYLGAGKTTLIKHLLETSKTKIAILMNEFGDVGIDTQTLQGENVAIKELLEGCVCCSLQGEFEAGVHEIVSKYNPELIIVETTGIAEADNLILDIEEEIQNVLLQCVITLVDADLVTRFPEISGNLQVQIQSADLLIINKVDLVKDTSTIKEQLRELNTSAAIIQTTHSKVELDQILAVKHTRKELKITEKDHGMQSFSIELKQSLNKEKFIQFLTNLPAEVVRAKGYLTLDDLPYLLNYSNGNIDLTSGYGKQKIVFIGKDITKLKEKIQHALSTTF